MILKKHVKNLQVKEKALFDKDNINNCIDSINLSE